MNCQQFTPLIIIDSLYKTRGNQLGYFNLAIPVINYDSKYLVMALSELTEETRAKINDLLKYWKKWEHVKDADVLPLLDEIATCYGGKVIDR